MEIEAKYTTSDPSQFARLLKVDALGDYSLKPIEEQYITDHYIDTPNRAIWQGGYACRMREKNVDKSQFIKGEWLVTVKGRGGVEGAIHQREEYEMKVQPGTPTQQWPDGPTHDLILSLTHSLSLIELCVIRQHRTLRVVCQSKRIVGELSLDVVEIEADNQREIAYELEIELEQDGTLEDLLVLGDILQTYHLCPESRSKFERALALIK